MTKLYQVQSGDSLSKIANARLGDMNRWQELAYINSLEPPYYIHPGQIIQLPDDKAPPMEIVITKGMDEPAAPPDKQAGFSIQPATAFFLLAGAAALYYVLTEGK